MDDSTPGNTVSQQQRIDAFKKRLMSTLIICDECSTKIAKRAIEEPELHIEQMTQEIISFPNKKQKADFKFRLLASFESEPLEDGMDHPAEEIISDALKSAEQKIYLDWLRELALDTTNPSLADSVLVCLARQSSPGTSFWRVDLIDKALSSTDVRVRDAAVEASESWADLDVIPVLNKYHETEHVGWLRDYMQTVVNYIEARASMEKETVLR